MRIEAKGTLPDSIREAIQNSIIQHLGANKSATLVDLRVWGPADKQEISYTATIHEDTPLEESYMGVSIGKKGEG